MAYTNKGIKWELKNSLYLIFSFIPFFNAFCFFHMDGRVTNKKWRRSGWAVLILNISLIITIFTCAGLTGVEPEEVPYDTYPDLEDYLGRDYYSKYSGYNEYSKLPEYYDYLDAVDEWRSSDEVKRIKTENEDFQRAVESIAIGSVFAWFLTNLIVFFYLISLRANYLKALAKSTNKNDVINRLEVMNSAVNKKNVDYNFNNNSAKDNRVMVDNIVKNENQSTKVKTKTDKITGKLDINVATEEQLADLPLLTSIDAKRAIDYRQEHNGFESVDEFFEVINAKPHVIAKLDNTLFISNPRRTKIKNRTFAYKTNRRIDL